MNRFYRPTAPKYTSQFVEEQIPADLMMGYMNMKAGQQANFAENIGKLQAESSLIPNGLRTQDMAPRVRNKWSSAISEWSGKNMNNYDSPQAIAELSAMRTQFLNDPDVLLMKQDYEDSQLYKQIKIKSGPSDVDPNIEDPTTGRLFQFEEGTPYSPYLPVIGDPGVPEKILKEFSMVPTNKVNSPYLSYTTDPVTGEKIRVEGQRTTDTTNKQQFDITLKNMVDRAMNNKEDWSVYQNAKFRNEYGRDMTEEDWYNFIAPIAARTIKSDYSDVRDYGASPTSSDSGSGGMGTGATSTFTTPLIPKSNDTNMPSKKELRQHNLGNLFNIDDRTSPRVKILQEVMARDVPGWNSLSEREQSKMMKERIKEASGRTYSMQYGYWGPEVEEELNQVFAGKINTDGTLNATGAGVQIAGQTVVDLDDDKVINRKDKEKFASKDVALRFLGRPTMESKGLQKYPGLVIFESNALGKNKIYAIKMDDLAIKDKPTWNIEGFRRNVATGVGDVFAVDFSNSPDMMPMFSDVSDSDTNGKPENVRAKTQHGVYVVPVQDINPASGSADVRVKVFKANPSGTNVLDEDSDLLMKEYWLGDYKDVDEEGNWQPERGLYRAMATDFYTGKLKK